MMLPLLMCGGVKSNETIHAGMYNSFGFEGNVKGKHGDFFFYILCCLPFRRCMDANPGKET